LPGNQVAEKFRNPGTSWSAVVNQAAAASNILHFDGVSRRPRAGRTLAARFLDVQRKVVGRKSKTDHLGRERQLIASGNQVMVEIAAQNRLSLFAETQVNRVRDLRDLLFLFHDAPPSSIFARLKMSKVRAMKKFPFYRGTLQPGVPIGGVTV